MQIRIEVLARPFRWILQRSVAVLARLHVPASFLTFASFGFCIVAGILFGTGSFFSAGVVLVPAAACDLLARPLARLQPRGDFFGAFLKSVLHRYADLAIFMGLLVYYSTVNRFLYALLTGFVMAGAVMVSYSQARAESLIDRCRVGFWERPERLGLLIIGCLLNWLPYALPITLIILAVGTNSTVSHRIYHTWKETEDRASFHEAVAPSPRSVERQSPIARSGLHTDPRAGQDSRLRDLLARTAKRGS